MLAAYVLTCGSPELTRRTVESVSWADLVEVVDLRRSSAADLLPAVAHRAADRPGWSLVLVDGDAVDGAELRGAFATGSPRRSPMRRTPASIAGDPVRLTGPRLFGPGELSAASSGAAGAAGAGDGAAPWWIDQVPLALRVGDDGWASWARRRAVRLSREQLDRGLDEREALWLAELLLLARERDAVVVRARTALAGGLSRWARARWCELGVAAAASGPREAEAVDFAEALRATGAGTTSRATASAWAAVAAERVLDFSTASARWQEVSTAGDGPVGAQGDPWMHLVTGRRGTPNPQQVTAAALAVRAQRPSSRGELAQLVELWRAAGLPASELVEDWPREHADVLLGVAATSTGSSRAWRLGLLDGLHRSGVVSRAEVAHVALSQAARVSAEASSTWSQRADQLGLRGSSALEVRAEDPLVRPGQRVLAAVLWWRGRRAARGPFLERVVSRVHPEEVEEVLAEIDHAAAADVPHVLGLLCQEPARALEVERLIGVGASA